MKNRDGETEVERYDRVKAS